MNAASQRMAAQIYGTPTIARGMAEVDARRFGGIHHIAAKHRVPTEAHTYQPAKARKAGPDRDLKVAVLRRNIDAGRVSAEAMPALLRDYPELRSGLENPRSQEAAL